MKKYIIGGLIVILLIVIGFVLRGDEDIYICRDGVWVVHGNPTEPPPQTQCGESIAGKDVKLYYYDPKKDADASGNILCSRQGLVAVWRRIPLTSTDPLTDTLKLLLNGIIRKSESAAGVTTEFPLEGVILKDVRNDNGDVTLTFDDPNAKTGGGSCRVSILWAQISETAKQFPEVKTVRFMPEELFQP